MMPRKETDSMEEDALEEVRSDNEPHSESALESAENSSTGVASVTATASMSTFSGPLPRPEILAQYDKVLPGLAERIVSMAERREEHQQSIEKTVVEGGSKRADRGLIIGAIVAIILILCGTFLVYNGHDWAGTTLVVATIVGLVGVFVYNTQKRKSERIEALREAESAFELEERD